MSAAETVRQLAHSWLTALPRPTHSNPREALSSLQWEITAHGTQSEIAQANAALAPSYCLGRIALCAAYLERYFPLERVEYAEVLEDALRNLHLHSIPQSPSNDYLQELLLYEEPHCLLLIGGIQFDPLLNQLRLPVEHPRIESYPVWDGIASAWLVARSTLESDPIRKLEMLQQAYALCPGTTLVAENMCGAYLLLGMEKEAQGALAYAIQKRPVARSLFCAHLLGDQRGLKGLTEEYPAGLIELLQSEAN